MHRIPLQPHSRPRASTPGNYSTHCASRITLSLAGDSNTWMERSSAWATLASSKKETWSRRWIKWRCAYKSSPLKQNREERGTMGAERGNGAEAIRILVADHIAQQSIRLFRTQ